MSNLIRQQLLAHGTIRPAITTKGKVSADPDAVRSHRHELVGRKAAKACAILNAVVHKARREKNNERRDDRHWR